MNTEQKKNFKEAIRCLYQKGIELNEKNVDKKIRETETFVRFVPIDGKASEEQVKRIYEVLPKEMKNLSVEEAVHIGNLMDAQKSAADIFVDYNYKPNKLPDAEVNWAYKLIEYEPTIIKICPKTMRPFFTVNNNKWDEKAEKAFSVPVEKMMKGQKYYEGFIEKHKKIPTKDEIILFYYNRYVMAEKCNTLPYLTDRWVE